MKKIPHPTCLYGNKIITVDPYGCCQYKIRCAHCVNGFKRGCVISKRKMRAMQGNDATGSI